MEEPIRSEEVPAPVAGKGVIGPIRIEASRNFSARSRMAVRGLNVQEEKEKVSLTLDRSLIEALRKGTEPKRLSATVNELLYEAIHQNNLRSLVEEMESEAGPASAEVYQELLDEWFGVSE